MGRKISSIYHSNKFMVPAWERSNGWKHEDHYKKPIPKGAIASGKQGQASKMRANPTGLERILYAMLERISNGRYRILKQSVQRGYILDAYLPDLELCFEADGPYHNAVKDQHRDIHLFKAGIRTIRFTQRELHNDKTTVESIIRYQLRNKRS